MPKIIPILGLLYSLGGVDGSVGETGGVELLLFLSGITVYTAVDVTPKTGKPPTVTLFKSLAKEPAIADVAP